MKKKRSGARRSGLGLLERMDGGLSNKKEKEEEMAGFVVLHFFLLLSVLY